MRAFFFGEGSGRKTSPALSARKAADKATSGDPYAADKATNGDPYDESTSPSPSSPASPTGARKWDALLAKLQVEQAQLEQRMRELLDVDKPTAAQDEQYVHLKALHNAMLARTAALHASLDALAEQEQSAATEAIPPVEYKVIQSPTTVQAVQADASLVLCRVQSPPTAQTKSERSVVKLEKPFAEMYVVEQVVHDGGEQCRVKKVRSLDDGKWYIAKVQHKLKIRGRREDVFRQMTERMINLDDSPYVNKVLACYEDKEYFYTILEYMEGGDLYTFFKVLHPPKTSSMHHSTSDRLDQEDLEDLVRKIMRQVLKALQHLHVQGLIHKDVKLENFVFKRKPRRVESQNSITSFFDSFFTRCAAESSKITIPSELKLIDFDFVQEWNGADAADERNSSAVVLGTDGYIAPEVYLGAPRPESDVFSAGVILYVLISGRLPYSRSIFDDDEHENHVGHPKMAAIHARLAEYQVYFGTVWDRFPEAKDLCESMLAVDGKKRPDAREALRHPWFASPTGVPDAGLGLFAASAAA
jgi:serine/threonine protein kinase